MVTALDLYAIKARLAVATPEPWRVAAGSETPCAYVLTGSESSLIEIAVMEPRNEDDLDRVGADAELIAHAPTDLAALVAEVAACHAEIERLQFELALARDVANELRKDLSTLGLERARLAERLGPAEEIADAASIWVNRHDVEALDESEIGLDEDGRPCDLSADLEELKERVRLYNAARAQAKGGA